MAESAAQPVNLEGGCACSAVRYRISSDPLAVHACHCRDCQKLTGSAFVINLWIEREFVEQLSGAPKSFELSGGSGKPHQVFFCPECGTYLWSRYHASPGDTLFLRAGTLDRPEAVTPDAHIHTRSKLPWLELPSGIPAFEGFYELKSFWSDEKRQRLRAHSAKHAGK